MKRRDLLKQVTKTSMVVSTILATGSSANAATQSSSRAGAVLSFGSINDIIASEDLREGDLAIAPSGVFNIVAESTFSANPATVLDVTSSGVQAVLGPCEMLLNLDALHGDTRTPDWFGDAQTVTVVSPDLLLRIASTGQEDHHFETPGGLRLAAQPDSNGRLPVLAFDVAPAKANPDPLENAAAFQAWIDAHEEFQTILLPNWDILLGAGIDFGRRNVMGQGDISRLRFSDLDDQQDAVTLSGSIVPGERTGVIRNCVIDCQGSGRDGIRWTGGVRCGAEFVTVIAAGRDMYHFEQSDNNRFFERAFLNQCDGNKGSGRYGLCLALAPFGADDVQFINKSSFSDTKLYGAGEADVAFLLHSDDGGGTDTKIGGGVSFRNFHTQYQGDSPSRRGGAVFIHRSASSHAFIDMLSFDSCTFESQGSGAGAPTHGGALEVVDEAGDPGSILRVLEDRHTLLTGYLTWWDMQAKPDFVQKYRVETPLQGTRTNMSQRQFGTRTDAVGKTEVPARGEAKLFDAGTGGQMWLTSVRTANNANAHTTAIVLAGNQPRVHELTRNGKLAVDIIGSEVVAANSGNGSLYCYWSAVPLTL